MYEYQVKALLAELNLSWQDFDLWIRGQTLTSDKDGQTLYYRSDVHRFIGVFKYGQEERLKSEGELWKTIITGKQ